MYRVEKYLDMKAKTFWKFSKCVLFQRPAFNLEKGKITLIFSVETKDLWYPLLTDKHLQKGVQADCTKADDKYFRNREGILVVCVVPGGGEREGDIVEGRIRDWTGCWRRWRRRHLRWQGWNPAEDHSIKAPPCKWSTQWRGFDTWAWWRRRPRCWATRFQVCTSLRNWTFVWEQW